MSNRDGNGEGQSHWSLREYITSPRALFLVLGIAVAVALGYGIYTGNNTILVALSGFLASISVFLVYRLMKANYEWNRRKTTAEIIDKLMSGEFGKKTSELQEKFSFNISDNRQTYDTIVAAIPDFDRPQKVKQFDNILKEIFSSIEYMAMLKKHHIIDDEICYDFLGFVVTELYRWSLPYLSKLQQIHPRLHTDFRTCGEEWSNRRENEEQAFRKTMEVCGTRCLEHHQREK